MTEDEAKAKWCPVASGPAGSAASTTNAGGRNVDGTMYDGCKCIASDCMVWTGSGCGLMLIPSAPAAQKSRGA
jgi:hypothetical protein